MRDAFNKREWTINDEGQVVSVNLGYDYCAEHEWGIAGLARLFGIPDQGEGVEARQMTRGEDRVLFHKSTATPKPSRNSKKKESAAQPVPLAILMTTNSYASPQEQLADALGRVWLDSGALDAVAARGESLQTAWDERGFRIIALGAKGVEYAEQLHQAFLAKDVCLSQGGALSPFERAGLCLSVASRVPQTVRDAVLAADRDHAALLAAAKATGIEKALEAAGKRYYALSPRWTDATKSEVSFWLNPAEQRQYEAGWYSAEQLREWIEDKGPVVSRRPS